MPAAALAEACVASTASLTRTAAHTHGALGRRGRPIPSSETTIARAAKRRPSRGGGSSATQLHRPLDALRREVERQRTGDVGDAQAAADLDDREPHRAEAPLEEARRAGEPHPDRPATSANALVVILARWIWNWRVKIRDAAPARRVRVQEAAVRAQARRSPPAGGRCPPRQRRVTEEMQRPERDEPDCGSRAVKLTTEP